MKSVIITGGAAGIGEAAAKRLLADGWHVGVIDLAETRFEHANLRRQICDITDEDGMAKAFEAMLDGAPPLKGLVNSGGVGLAAKVRDATPEFVRKVLDVNVVGTFIPCSLAIDRLEAAGGGAIVNLASVAGNRGSMDRVAYGPSKAAVINMTEVMALELADVGIRVNAIAPGPVETELVAKMHDQKTRDGWMKLVPQRRYADPAEISGSIAFLLSEEASFITGHTLNVDGGYTGSGLQSV